MSAEVVHRVEAALDRFNRAAMIGVEATPALFIEALEAEGLHLAPVTAVDQVLDGYAHQIDAYTLWRLRVDILAVLDAEREKLAEGVRVADGITNLGPEPGAAPS